MRFVNLALVSYPAPLHVPIRYTRNLRRILREYGPYDVVHSHVHYFSGLVLRIAADAGVPVRIAHSHSDTSRIDSGTAWKRRLYLGLMRRWLYRYATAGIAASDLAATALWGVDWRNTPRWRKLYCGIDTTPFEATIDPQTVRTELNIMPDAYVLGHVGRFDVMKNHWFVLQIVHRARQTHRPLVALFVGDGPLRTEIVQQAIDLGIRDRIVFTGSRGDVPRLLLAGMDAFILPSSWEGLPVSAIEAQAAGLPVIISDVVTREVDIVPGLLTWLALPSGADAWLNACLASIQAPRPVSQRGALEIIKASPFNVQSGIMILNSYIG